MKPILFALLITFVFPLAFAVGASMAVLERQRLVAHLEMTGAWLSDEVSGLSPAQLQFRPAPGVWSILEVLEHLTVASPIYWRQFHEAMKMPAGRSTPQGTDADILWYGIDRTQREKAIPSEDAKGQLRDLRPALDSLRGLHAEMLQYAKTTNDDLRGHYVERQRSDAYQWLLLISTHEQRHILQIREIKANPRFPKK
jgi:uncharacterized damage-inducible protein DinB